jgi:cytochrome P450
MTTYLKTKERPSHIPSSRVVDFDIYNPPNVAEGLLEAWSTLGQPSIPELVWTPYNEGHWLATRCSVIKDILSNHELFTSRVVLVPKSMGEAIHFLPVSLDPPLHRPYRMLLNESLSSPRAVKKIEPRVRDTAIEMIERLRLRGHCDFTTDFAQPMPIRVFLSLVDLPQDDAPKLKHWVDQLARPTESMTAADSEAAVHAYLLPYIESRRGGTGEDMLSVIINRQVNGRELDPSEALGMCTNVLYAGLDTLVNLLSFVMLFLAQHPEHRRQLVENPALIPAAVEELTRRFPVVTGAREVRNDMEYRGVIMKRGEMIVAPTQLAGLDERENERPMEVDFRRTRSIHATFGSGVHLCPGANLARAELRITLQEWLARIPEFSIAPGAKIGFSGGIVGVVNALPLSWDPEKAPGRAH